MHSRMLGLSLLSLLGAFLMSAAHAQQSETAVGQYPSALRAQWLTEVNAMCVHTMSDDGYMKTQLAEHFCGCTNEVIASDIPDIVFDAHGADAWVVSHDLVSKYAQEIDACQSRAADIEAARLGLSRKTP